MHSELNFYFFSVNSYAFFVALGFLLGTLVLNKICFQFGITEKQAFLSLCVSEIGVITGGKILFLIVNLRRIPAVYEKHGFFKLIFSGGFVFYGGLIFAFFLVFIYCKIFRLKFFNILSALFVVAPLIHSLGRIGCLFSGCCYGIPYNGIFSVFIRGAERIPVQLIESIGNFLIFIIQILLLHKHKKALIFNYLISYAVLRFFCEFLRGDFSRGFVGILSVSQWICIAMVVAVLMFFQLRKKLS